MRASGASVYLLRLLGGLADTADTSEARFVIFLTPCWWNGLRGAQARRGPEPGTTGRPGAGGPGGGVETPPPGPAGLRSAADLLVVAVHDVLQGLVGRLLAVDRLA